MDLMRLIGRLDRWAGRFNDWFGATAVAAHTGSQGAAERRPAADPAAVVALLGEIENEGKIHDDDPDPSPPRHSDRRSSRHR
jgi:hypothetical protein